MRRAAGARELLDESVAPADLDATLRDIDRLNLWFGGYALTLSRVRRLARTVPSAQPLVVVDLGGGRGDFAVRLARWARRTQRRIRVVVLERDPAAVRVARVACARWPEITVVRGDATSMPLRAAGVDVVTASLTLHHLEPDEATASLAEMRRAAQRGFVVNDLLRSYLSLALVWLATRVLSRHPISRHDGPLSVRRAYAPHELRALAARAGIAHLTIARYPLLARVVAEAA